MLNKWDQRFLQLADHVSTWSKDPSTQVGAVIANGKHVVSLGFNGFPNRLPDVPSLLANREAKYERIIHGEINAILNAPGRVDGNTLYCNRPPCSNCTLAAIAAGIGKVIFTTSSDPLFQERWGESITKSKALLEEAGLEYVEHCRD